MSGPEPRRPADAAPERTTAGEPVDEPAEEPAEEPAGQPAGAPEEPAASGGPATEEPATRGSGAEGAGAEGAGAEAPAARGGTAVDEPAPAEPGPGGPGEPAADGGTADPEPGPDRPTRRRRDPRAAVLIGALTLLLGFALAVQVRTTDTGEVLAGAREADLVRILDELDDRESRLRQQIAEQRSDLAQLTSSDTRSLTAVEAARQRAQAFGILTGTVAAQGQGLRVSIVDPQGQIRVADLIDVVQELRGAGAETMEIDDVRVGVDTALTGRPGELRVDGRSVASPYEVVVIGSPQSMETALNIPGGAVQRITGRGGSVTVTQSETVQVDALRALDTAQYAAPRTGG